MVGTDASIELMKTLISNDDISGKMADMWLASLAFVHHPTKGMIKHLQVNIAFPKVSTSLLKEI